MQQCHNNIQLSTQLYWSSILSHCCGNYDTFLFSVNPAMRPHNISFKTNDWLSLLITGIRKQLTVHRHGHSVEPERMIKDHNILSSTLHTHYPPTAATIMVTSRSTHLCCLLSTKPLLSGCNPLSPAAKTQCKMCLMWAARSEHNA